MGKKLMIHKTHYLETLKEMLEYNVKHNPDNVVFLKKTVKGGEYIEITYRSFYTDVNALGTKLINMGLEGSRIALAGEGSYEWMVAYFAITCGVGIVVPLDKELNKEELMNFITVSECRGVIYSDSLSKYFKDENIELKINMNPRRENEGEYNMNALILEGAVLLNDGNGDYMCIDPDPDKMSILLFTSGTTASSKGVMLSHRNIVSNIIAVNKIVKVNPEDRALSLLPIHHTFGLTIGILTPMYAGASVAFCEGLKYIVKNLQESQASMLVAVPLIFESMYGKIIKTARKNGKEKALMKGIAINKKMKKIGVDLSAKLFKDIYANFGGRLRLLVTGAAAIDPGAIRFFEDLNIKVVQGFGMTECSPLITGTPDSCDTYKKAGSVGPAIPGTLIKVINRDEEGVGEIICTGPGVMLGYYEDEEQTSEVIKNGWLHTGDLGYLDDDEFLFVTGRMKNVIITKNGKNVYPEELEYYINGNDFIAESMVEGVYDPKDDDVKICVQIYPDFAGIREKLGENPSDEDILSLMRKTIDTLNETMPAYKRIKRVILKKEEFIKTTTRKIKRQDNSLNC